MHTEAIFLASYAFLLTLIAVWFEWLGHRSTDPWASRTLAASRPPAEKRTNEAPDWPHSEVPVFHLGLSAVVLTAASALVTVSAVRYVGAIELVVHVALLALVGTRIRHVIVAYRTMTRGQKDAPACTRRAGGPVGSSPATSRRTPKAAERRG